MSQDEHPQKCARARHKARTKEGSNNALAPLRRQGATHQKGARQKSPCCVVLKTYHPTGIHHKTCMKHSSFLNRKLCVQLFPTWNTMATARGLGTEEKQNTPKRVETRFKTRQLQHAPSPDWALSRTASSSSNLRIPLHPWDSRGFKSWSARKQGDCCIGPICHEWNACQHKMRKQGK